MSISRVNDKDISVWLIAWVFLRLGFTSFGGPAAHLAYFRQEIVERRGWLDEQRYADLVALCQFLPGPASSQVGIGIGLLKGGWRGALAAWCCFTLPSVLLLVVLTMGLAQFDGMSGVVHGLKLLAVAVIAQAVWAMGKTFCQTRWQQAVVVLSCLLVWLLPWWWAQLLVIMLAAIVGIAVRQTPAQAQVPAASAGVSVSASLCCALLFFALLLGLPLAAQLWPVAPLQQFDVFYRIGSLVFGGGHVVLPLLEAELVGRGWVDASGFLAGYGLTQAVPGPLFTFAAYLGAIMSIGAGGLAGALWCTLAIFLPSFLLVGAALPWWHRLRSWPWAGSALAGVNAAVVGLLLAALYQPVWVDAVLGVPEVSLALLLFAAMQWWRLPVWGGVLLAILAGYFCF